MTDKTLILRTSIGVLSFTEPIMVAEVMDGDEWHVWVNGWLVESGPADVCRGLVEEIAAFLADPKQERGLISTYRWVGW
uniref:Uncharacterized protein n=1 Tax=viral metagenome TaxID=1070528 RepID=A0A6M3L1J0_9ZZZZ